MLLLYCRPFPSPCPPLRRLLRCRCTYSSASSSIAPYHQSFARRMALAGIHPHHRIAVGVSGGPDSTALCVLTAAWKKAAEGRSGRKSEGFVEGLLGVVVDHGLRLESADEAQLVRDRVHGMGVMCEIARCEWPNGRPNLGHLQEAAREMRYQKLLDICIKQQIGVLLIAHHSDDQAELFVLRLSRNSRVLGLAGTAFVSQLFAPNLKYDGHNFCRYGILLVRPMLDFSKDDMYKICQGSNHFWVEDPTNNSMQYARNRIRASLRCLSTEGTFQLELQKLIYACRLTRACVDNACSMAVKQSITITEYGYAVIDLEKLDAQNVDDLSLSQYLACVLQFVSQRHRPIRGRSARLFMDYIRNTPCKGALTVAGCYLCAFPKSKGTKVLVCSSVDSMESFSVEMSYKCSYEEQPSPVPEIDQIAREARVHSNEFLHCSSISFANYSSSTDVLNRAKDRNIIGDFVLEKLLYLQTEEHQKFCATKHKNEEQYLEKTNFPDVKVLFLWPGETCHFMSKFLITWNVLEVVSNGICSQDSKNLLCQHCAVNQDGSLAVRHMFDTDWLFLAEVSKIRSIEENHNVSKVSINKLEDDGLLKHSRYLQLSAMKALEVLKSIPASARRTLPVLTNSQGDILSIPSIGFQCCPSLSIKALFHPRVPLGGGYTSYL
ncbi:hypothetical protein CFC21_087921 [Triticum aestivum]|uniref:tRNA(Ile)-lysidine synthetase n=3 Tax=Triticum TaxID=4564 RepID=A0A9R0YK00_TRITD|nr:uncharacterized protein LOC119324046 [Triticum dicoccoides]XP_044412315.1 uncharacterized protein LOC123136875 [Triticum aestivum]XP_044412316.1 uncharacterized protein LOC123136875 [Triticum aestivum]KAF7084254.1 hypothetical protein CFC21_087921 [Triticum aestivum]VAI56863.1 unnamed protein product [Triticum turgidum subsp. durum]